MTGAWVLAGALLVVPPPERPIKTGEQRLLHAATALFAATAVWDWASTTGALGRGGEEANPLFRRWRSKPATVTALGSLLDVAGTVAWRRLVGKNHPRLATAGLVLASAFRVWLALHNWGVCGTKQCDVIVPSKVWR